MNLTRREFFEGTIERFWSKVDRSGPDDCWIWKGTIALPNKCGQRYGSFGISEGKSVNYRAHRFAWMLCNGSIPEEMVIMHTCDVPLCVNPAHLKLGTQAENVTDRDIKGRTAKGENHGHSKLTETQARFIKHSTERPECLLNGMAYTQPLLRQFVLERIGHIWLGCPPQVDRCPWCFNCIKELPMPKAMI